MAKAKKDTKDFVNLPVSDWNGTTFREYAKHLNTEKFGIPCVTGAVQIENSLIKNFCKEYGNEVLKKFIEACVASYNSTNPQYPTVNIFFMLSYMKTRELPKILGEVAKQTKLQKLREQLKESEADVEDYF